MLDYAQKLGAHGFQAVLNLSDPLYPLLFVFPCLPLLIGLDFAQHLKAEPLL
jgi:hypothetical protein